MTEVQHERAAAAVRELLAACGLDADSPQFAKTPLRVATALSEFVAGVGVDPVPALRDNRILLAPEQAADAQVVLLRNIRFRALCEHHLLPFDGWVQLAYLPGDSIVGLGHLYDLVETCAARPTLQENFGDTLVDALMLGLAARGAVAVIEARQGCVSDRGPRQADSETVTLAARGELADPQARADVLRMLTLGASERSES